MIDRFSREDYDIEVEIAFVSTSEGGRTQPILSGYRPQFSYDGHDWDAIHHYPGREQVLPGETVHAFLTFLSPEYHTGRIFPGMLFDIKEGHRIIGRGHILRILNLVAAAAVIDANSPIQYWKGYWPEDRGDEYADWGGATYYFACLASGFVLEQLEIYDNGCVLWYDETHPDDTYGGLSTAPLGRLEDGLEELSSTSFHEIRNRSFPINRLPPELATRSDSGA